LVAERVLSFQITVLKVLAGHPDGRASVAELTRYVSVLMSSGSDWSDRMRILAHRVPNLDIFSDRLVIRDDAGWHITDGGRQLLSSLEAPVAVAKVELLSEKPVFAAPTPVRPVLRIVVDNTRSLESDQGPDETRRSA
jgi:hypothetical protein